jgi:hypothetical protein
MAESEGFEPPEGFPSTVFKTAAFDHSASSPGLYSIYAITVFKQLSFAVFAQYVG